MLTSWAFNAYSIVHVTLPPFQDSRGIKVWLEWHQAGIEPVPALCSFAIRYCRAISATFIIFFYLCSSCPDFERIINHYPIMSIPRPKIPAHFAFFPLQLMVINMHKHSGIQRVYREGEAEENRKHCRQRGGGKGLRSRHHPSFFKRLQLPEDKFWQPQTPERGILITN